MGPKAKAPAPKKPAATIAEVVAHLELLGHKDAAAEVLDKFGEGAVATSPWAAAAGSDGKLAVETRLTCKDAGVAVKYVAMDGPEGPGKLEAMMTEKVSLVMVESPTNPMQRVCDLRGLAKVAHAHGALLEVDNTLMSPLLQKPLQLGADIVVHFRRRFVAGHSDTMAGVVCVDDDALAKRLYFAQNAEGTGLAPFDCWLALRGDRRRLRRLLHDGSTDLSKHVVSKTQLFNITVSFGSVHSLISCPCDMSHASIPAEVRASREFPEDIVRVCVGIEDADDPIADLDQAFASYRGKSWFS
ncbi:cystathionine gamma-synthase [Aureococcus anophagefferens]|uniref:Cystathionine gamma-synthase n=1 Tax=Aureococcus anophagefferens TaxID=44056 RepID=A0ABR1G444_AURAN